MYSFCACNALFPAHAGVIPRTASAATRRCSFPRTRGGDPARAEMFYAQFGFSPHTRGVIPARSVWNLTVLAFLRTCGGTEAVSSVNGKTHGAICTVGFRILSSKPAQRPRYSLVTDAATACFCTCSMPQSSRSLAATFGPLYSLVSSNGRNASCPSAVT